MSYNQRLYFLSLLIVLMLWYIPAKAEIGSYGKDSGCPVLAVPTYGSRIYDLDSGGQNLYPLDTAVYITADAHSSSFDGCALQAESGTYYDGENHLWILGNDLNCSAVDIGDDFDLWSGTEY